MPSSQPRNTDAHAMSSSVPASLSSSSLSSSFTSSRASSDLLPAAPLSNSSQSDIVTSDRSVSSLSSSSKARFFPLVLTSTSVPSRPAPLATMGQSQARPTAPASPPPLSPVPSTTSSTGNRFKRAWAGRRKKSEDITGMFSGSERAKGKDREGGEGGAAAHPPSAMPDLSELRLERPPSRGLGGPKLLNLPSVFGGKKANQQQKPSPKVGPDVHPTLLPPLPPKPVSVGQRTPSSSPPHTPAKDGQFSTLTAVTSPKHHPPIHHSQPSRHPSEGGDVGTSMVAEKLGSQSPGSQEKDKAKEDWRKSDSTMASHSTIRPGALSGNRSPRPVSLAESSHSATTIVAPVNKRLSALITDAEFTMFEETDGSVSEHETIPRAPASGRPSPTSSLKARNRRSASLSLAPIRRPDASSGGRNFTDNPLASSRDTPTLTRAAAAGIISPVSASGSTQAASNNIRGRLAAWSAASAPSPQPQSERALPTLPPPQPRRPPGSLNPPPVNPIFRQTAVSMTGSLAPAAGIAMGFGKRAVEKVGRAWGGLTSTSSNHSGYSSSSSTGMSDSTSASSRHSGPNGRKARRKAPHFSNASSISSLASSSSEDHYSPAGPQLGKRLRGPKLSSSGFSIAGGLVFKRDLQTCVRETAIDDILTRIANGQEEADTFGFRPLESRLLPALILRCVQHILRWGVEEEGLFRISGRSSHVARLRAEFDAGADYLLSECEPGDLDPHAVSSIFKAFLREMPEPVLTSVLLPYFESALADDQGRRSDDATMQEARTPVSPTSDSHLPLRKPPSLSTLAMPSFAGARAVSDAQLNAFSWLISRLPQENRDLLYTVIELIKITAARSKETKMPLGNLLLVFCPSLNMSPSLLRVLCEAAGIWDGPSVRLSQDATPEAARADMAPPDRLDKGSRVVVPAINLRLPIIELDDAPDNLRDSPDDAASFVSALEPPSNAPTRTPSPLIYSVTIPPLSSSDSLDSSSVSEELVSPDPPLGEEVGDNKSFLSAHSLAIPECSALSLPASPHPAVSVPFPSSGGSVPHSPVTHQPLTHRKSYTLLSFPHLRPESTSTSTFDVGCDEQGPAKRPKRPSLHLLFSKKSTASLPSVTSSAAVLVGSTAGARPNTHLASSPPRLDTTISSSPIYLGFDANVKQLRGKDFTVRSAPSIITSTTPDAPALNSRSDSGGSSVFSTPQSTPIADYYRGRTTSLFLPDTPSELSPPLRTRSASQVSDTPSIDIEVAETQQDDWTQSVLLAAHAGQTSRG